MRWSKFIYTLSRATCVGTDTFTSCCFKLLSYRFEQAQSTQPSGPCFRGDAARLPPARWIRKVLPLACRHCVVYTSHPCLSLSLPNGFCWEGKIGLQELPGGPNLSRYTRGSVHRHNGSTPPHPLPRPSFNWLTYSTRDALSSPRNLLPSPHT